MPPRKARKSGSKAKVPSSAPRTSASPAAAATSRARDEAVARFIREQCMLREDLQGAIPTIHDLNDVEFADLAALRKPALETDDVERARLEQVALASFPDELRTFRSANALKLYMWLADCNPRQFSSTKSPDDQIAYLELATTTFICLKSLEGQCPDPAPFSKAKHYPYVLSHACLQGGTHDSDMPEGRPWAPCALMPHDDDSEIIVDIVRACGLDPTTATLEEMDKLDARLACKACLERNMHEADGISNWWGCLGHFHATHCGDQDPNPLAPRLPADLVTLKRGDWIRLNPVAEAKAREICPALTKDQMTSWRCALCRRAPTILKTWSLAQSHVEIVHGARAAKGTNLIAQDNYVEHYEDPVYVWQLRKAGLQEYFDSRALDKLYFDKLIKIFGKVPTTFPNRPAEKCSWE
ncbi:hypothetical protein AURDEDRAFT_184850 [Auricularia subglabra TFB-10046 SS5]|nr:hypothetical protein AURDEDRAFT_184850 [Auricularia subglabra TFB-10046 SS5]